MRYLGYRWQVLASCGGITGTVLSEIKDEKKNLSPSHEKTMPGQELNLNSGIILLEPFLTGTEYPLH